MNSIKVKESNDLSTFQVKHSAQLQEAHSARPLNNMNSWNEGLSIIKKKSLPPLPIPQLLEIFFPDTLLWHKLNDCPASILNLMIFALNVQYLYSEVINHQKSENSRSQKGSMWYISQLTRRLIRRVCTFNVALQLKWGGKLTVTVLAGGMAFPAFTALLLKL